MEKIANCSVIIDDDIDQIGMNIEGDDYVFDLKEDTAELIVVSREHLGELVKVYYDGELSEKNSDIDKYKKDLNEHCDDYTHWYYCNHDPFCRWDDDECKVVDCEDLTLRKQCEKTAGICDWDKDRGEWFYYWCDGCCYETGEEPQIEPEGNYLVTFRFNTLSSVKKIKLNGKKMTQSGSPTGSLYCDSNEEYCCNNYYYTYTGYTDKTEDNVIEIELKSTCIGGVFSGCVNVDGSIIPTYNIAADEIYGYDWRCGESSDPGAFCTGPPRVPNVKGDPNCWGVEEYAYGIKESNNNPNAPSYFIDLNFDIPICSDSCDSEGYECGQQTICGKTVSSCGECLAGYECVSGKCVEEAGPVEALLSLVFSDVNVVRSGSTYRYVHTRTFTETNGVGVTLTSGRLCSTHAGCTNANVNYRIDANGELIRNNEYFSTTYPSSAFTLTYWGVDDNGNPVSVSASMSVSGYTHNP